VRFHHFRGLQDHRLPSRILGHETEETFNSDSNTYALRPLLINNLQELTPEAPESLLYPQQQDRNFHVAHPHEKSRRIRGRIITDIMPLIDQVQQEMVAAMKSKDAARLSALRMLKAALMKQKVDSPKPIDASVEIQVLKILINQRVDAAEAFRKAGRIDSAEKEEAEKAILEAYLPAGATEEEIDAAVAGAMAETGATSIKQMGVVMKAAQAKLTGKTVDGKALSDKVRSRLP
jgi:uncharacterized protein YqeY